MKILSLNKKLLLLENKRVALGDGSCSYSDILIITQGHQHPHCVRFQLETWGYAEVTPPQWASRAYNVERGVGSFDVGVRWRSSHSPYPEIIAMRVIVFGVDLGFQEFPKADDPYKKVATVTMKENGEIIVCKI